ncbi:MAG: deoxyguanosinetriphosphate triphosphohydrolase [Oscillospiraceae bacterium]|nr:deoxyguanosinetriphosphate triphosphohydrolase [Oscillospiraceae bacterium]
MDVTVPRLKREAAERMILSARASFADSSRGRERPEEPCELRTCFQRDTDRIVHSKAFRRLKHKTQVFLSPEGDHYRTRMTHTLEVARIARTIARALELNEDLAEAIALGHDLGHTPFGHAGERALRSIMGQFDHNRQSLRVVDKLEKNGRGLNLCWEVRDGILTHTGDVMPQTPEGQIVRLSDRIAYVNHDTDDAVRAGIISETDIPEAVRDTLGNSYGERINTVIADVVRSSSDEIGMSLQVAWAMDGFRKFLFSEVYDNPKAKSEESKVEGILAGLFDHYMKNTDQLPDEYINAARDEGMERAVCDYISGMTDQYAVHCFSEIYIPVGWQK